jgi:hypothetical protein
VRHVAALALLAAVYLGSGCVGSGTVVGSRAKWEAAGIESYSYFVHEANCCLGGDNRFTVVVSEGRVTEGAERSSLPPGIDDLFDYLGDPEADHVEVEYDDRLGYPTHIEIDPREEVYDDDFTVDILNFRETGT